MEMRQMRESEKIWNSVKSMVTSTVENAFLPQCTGAKRIACENTQARTWATQTNNLSIIASVVANMLAEKLETVVNVVKRMELSQCTCSPRTHNIPSPRSVHVRNAPVSAKAAAKSAAVVVPFVSTVVINMLECEPDAKLDMKSFTLGVSPELRVK